MDERYIIQPVEETRETIFESTIDISTDISEICIDMLQEEGVIKDFPVLGTVYKVGKTVCSVGRLAYIKKILVFAQELQRNNVENDVLEEHKRLMESNPKKYYKELEIIIEYINRQVGCEKSVLNGRVYYLYLSGRLVYEDFILLLETIDMFQLSDKEQLEKIYRKKVLIEGNSYNTIACARLSYCGLIDYFNGIRVNMPGDDRTIIARISNLGVVFCEEVLRVER